jgi:RimJ/RimL family protein N-acetyltransferase
MREHRRVCSPSSVAEADLPQVLPRILAQSVLRVHHCGPGSPRLHYLTTNSVPPDVLTPRLRIRNWTLDDLGPVAEIFADPRVWSFPFGRGFTSKETEEYLARKIEAQDSGMASPSAVELLENGRLIGYVSLAPPGWLPEVMPAVEIGWRLDPTYWGRGLATEGARALLEYGFNEMDLPEILSIYEPANVTSGRVMRRLGFRFERETVHPWFNRPLHIYRMTRGEWERATASRLPSQQE